MSGLEDDGSHPEATELSALIDGSQAEPRLPQDLKDEGVYPPFLFDRVKKLARQWLLIPGKLPTELAEELERIDQRLGELEDIGDEFCLDQVR